MIPSTFAEFKQKIRARGDVLRSHRIHPEQELGVRTWNGGMYPGGKKRRGRAPKSLDEIMGPAESDMIEP